MDRRVIATSKVRLRYEDKPEYGVKSSVPKVVMGRLDPKVNRFLKFRRDGWFQDVEFCDTKSKNTIPMTVTRGLQTIPRTLSAAMMLDSASEMDWHLVARPGRPFKIQVSRSGEKTEPVKPAGRSGKMSTHFIGATKVGKNQTQSSPQYYASVPRACFSILGTPEPSSVTWDNCGIYHKMVPCQDGVFGSRRITVLNTANGGRSYLAHFPERVRMYLYTGRDSRVEWYAASDGYGRWEIQIRPQKSASKKTA